MDNIDMFPRQQVSACESSFVQCLVGNSFNVWEMFLSCVAAVLIYKEGLAGQEEKPAICLSSHLQRMGH
jgi:hypothetical protein